MPTQIGLAVYKKEEDHSFTPVISLISEQHENSDPESMFQDLYTRSHGLGDFMKKLKKALNEENEENEECEPAFEVYSGDDSIFNFDPSKHNIKKIITVHWDMFGDPDNGGATLVNVEAYNLRRYWQ